VPFNLYSPASSKCLDNISGEHIVTTESESVDTWVEGSVTGVLPSGAPLQEIHEQRSNQRNNQGNKYIYIYRDLAQDICNTLLLHTTNSVVLAVFRY
jgi:hypothetical protein